jgi:hypothetical protein
VFDLTLGRRDFLRVGGLTAFGVGLPQLLRAEQTGRRTGARAKSVILVFLGGGLSHLDSFDPKPDAPEGVRGKYQPIDTAVPGLQIGELLPLMARTMDKVALVRSGAHDNDCHETATNWVLSGRFGSPFGDHPALGAVVAHEAGFTGTLPPYVAIPGNPSFTWELGKSAFLGGRYESFPTGDPNGSGWKVRGVGSAETVSPEWAGRRQSLLATVDDLARRVEGSDRFATADQFHQRAAAVVLSGEARSAFAIGREGEKLRDRYGYTTFGQSCLLARRLVERGVRFVTVNCAGWDHHAKIWERLEHKLPDFDRGFSALIDDLTRRGLLADTLVVAMGEFGRTPKINQDVGRDHWGPAASLLFAGAGVCGGLVLGATDRQGAYVTERPVTPDDVGCTLLEALGLDARGQLVTPAGRPVEVLDGGETVHELFA